MELRYLLRFLARQKLKIASLILAAALASLSLSSPEQRLSQVSITVLVTLLWVLLSAVWAARNKWLEPKEPPYNILHIVSSPHLDGAERVVQLLSRHVDPTRYRTVIACPGEPLQGIYQAEGFSVERLDANRPTPGSILGLWRILTSRHIQLIHAHDHRASLLAWLCAGVWERKPVISHLHSANPWLRHCHPFCVAEALLRNRYSLTVACSQRVRNYFLHHNRLANGDRILTVVNGVELTGSKRSELKPGETRTEQKESLGIPPANFVFGVVGRLEKVKGMDVLLQAFALLRTKVSGVSLLIVGTGSKAEELQSLAKELGIAGDVVFTGYREDVMRLMELMDVFTLASRWEGLPMVIMEAMSLGLPVIATDVGGVGEVVLHGKTGLLVETENVAGLAAGMKCLYIDRVLRENLGTAGRRLVEQEFNALAQAKKIQNIYNRLLRGEQGCYSEKQ